MPNFAINDGNTVVNVIVADSKEIAEEVTGLLAVETDGEPWTGWTLIDGEWVAPALPPEPEPHPEPAPEE